MRHATGSALGYLDEGTIRLQNDAEWNEAEYQIRKVKEGIIGAEIRGKPKDREWAARAKKHVAELEAAVREYVGRMTAAANAEVRGAGDSGYGELPYNAAIAQHWLEQPSRTYYSAAQNAALKGLAGSKVKFFLKDKSGLWAVLWISVDGNERQLSKKKMTLKDINGVLNGDFNHPIPGG